MKIAIIRATNEQVEILSVSGGWTTVRDQAGVEKKVRNGALTEPVEITAPTTTKLAKAKAEKAPKAPKEPKAPRAKKPLNERLNGVVESLYLQFYQGYTTTRKDGTKVRSMDKGDSVAQSLRGLSIEDVYKQAAKITHIGVLDLQARFGHLNPGMQRMNLGNMIRKAMRDEVAANA
jgi:hypothetical protein